MGLVALEVAVQTFIWAVVFGHSSGLLPLEAPVMTAEKRKLFCFVHVGPFGQHVLLVMIATQVHLMRMQLG